jgi:hypothetical protein
MAIARRAFTLIELCLGLVVTSLVMGAMAAFSLAMSTAWKSAESSQSISLLANQTIVRVQNEIRQCKLIGAMRSGTSGGSGDVVAVLLWKADTSGDGLIQGNEVSLLEYHATSHTLRLYYAGQPDASGTWSYDHTFTDENTLESFKTNRSYVVLARNVYGAAFQTSGTSGTSKNPSLHFGLKLMVDDTRSSGAADGTRKLTVQYGTATLRAPLSAPNN